MTAGCPEAAIPSLDPDLEATVAVQAAVIAELRAVNATLVAVNAEQARLIATLQARVAELSVGSARTPPTPPSRRLGRVAQATSGRTWGG